MHMDSTSLGLQLSSIPLVLLFYQLPQVLSQDLASRPAKSAGFLRVVGDLRFRNSVNQDDTPSQPLVVCDLVYHPFLYFLGESGLSLLALSFDQCFQTTFGYHVRPRQFRGQFFPIYSNDSCISDLGVGEQHTLQLGRSDFAVSRNSLVLMC